MTHSVRSRTLPPSIKWPHTHSHSPFPSHTFFPLSHTITQREAEDAAKGEVTPEEYKFDSNCITPGTAFMARLGKHLRFFIRNKMADDPVWQQPLVIFSGRVGG